MTGSVVGNRKITKIGAGQLRLTGINTDWAGWLDIKTGSVYVVGVQNLGSGAVLTRSGAILQETFGIAAVVATNGASTFAGNGTNYLRGSNSSGALLHKVVYAGSVLSPGLVGEAGALTIDSRDVTLGTVANRATLEIQLGGVSAGQYDALNFVTTGATNDMGTPGNLDLANVGLNVSLLPGYTPVSGSVFTIVNNAQEPAKRVVVGSFAATNLPSGWICAVNTGGGDGNDIELTLTTADSDSDSDGLADDWEVENFGTISATNGAAQYDADGDGMCNLAEYIAGTSPTNAGDKLQVAGFGVADGGSTTGMVISWSSKSGKWYAIKTSTNLMAGFDGTAISNIPSTPTLNTYTVLVDQIRNRYYRVIVEQ
jgi:hypothetical protein